MNDISKSTNRPGPAPVKYGVRIIPLLGALLIWASQVSLHAQSRQTEEDPSESGTMSQEVVSDSNGSGTEGMATRIRWNGLERALQLAGENDKTVLIFVFDPNCSFCRRMDSEVFPDPGVVEQINQYMLPVRIDVHSISTVRYFNRSFTQSEFARALDNKQVPTTYFMNKGGDVVGQQPGFIEPDLYALLIEFVGSGTFHEQSFDQFRREH